MDAKLQHFGNKESKRRRKRERERERMAETGRKWKKIERKSEYVDVVIVNETRKLGQAWQFVRMWAKQRLYRFGLVLELFSPSAILIALCGTYFASHWLFSTARCYDIMYYFAGSLSFLPLQYTAAAVRTERTYQPATSFGVRISYALPE